MRNILFLGLCVVVVACGGGGGSRPTDAPVIDDPIDAPMIDAPIDAPSCFPTAAPTQSAAGAPSCNPLSALSCSVGNQKCAWVQEGPNVGRSACVPDGKVQVGCACTVGPTGSTGYDDCVKGSACVGGVCKSICDPQGGSPMCDAMHACSRYAGLFETAGMIVAGVCDPTCDPLTQTVGTQAACASADPAAPNRGCYTFDLVKFTCAGVPTPALTRTDRMVAYGPASGGSFVNGCAAGYIPFFFESTGSSQVVCAGLCAPAKTDSTLVANAKGDATKAAKLHNQAAPMVGNGLCVPGKKGSEAQQNCHYLWWYNTDGSQPIPSPYNDTLGVCFGYTHYTYDHDGDPGTPNRTYPACESLPPKGATPGPDGTADQWACYSSVDAAAFAAPKPNPVASDFRIGRGAGYALPHLIR
jgi:hypothetical protein